MTDPTQSCNMLVQGISCSKLESAVDLNVLDVEVTNRPDLKGVLLAGHQIDVNAIIDEVHHMYHGIEIAAREIDGSVISQGGVQTA